MSRLQLCHCVLNLKRNSNIGVQAVDVPLGDVVLAESDGAFMAGRKAVPLQEQLPPTSPETRVNRTLSLSARSASTDVLVSPTGCPDPYRRLDSWPHDAQPRDIEDYTPSPMPTIGIGKKRSDPVRGKPTPSPTPTVPAVEPAPLPTEPELSVRSSGSDDPKKVRSDKFDKYYHQTLSCIEFMKV